MSKRDFLNHTDNQTLHKLLQRQLSKTTEGDLNPDVDLEKLCVLISQSYEEYEREIALGNNAFDIASDELIEANKVIRQQCDLYELALSGSNDGLWDWDCITQKVFYSPRWKQIIGYSENSYFETINDWFDRIHPDHKEQFKLELDLHVAAQTERFEMEYKILHHSGEYRWMLVQGKASRDSQGNVLRIAGCQTDINSQKEYQSQLAHSMLHDPLTGLSNRTLLMTRLEHFLQRISRLKETAIQGAVLYIDLDRFKVVNDNFGQSVGDDILKELAHRLEKFLRPDDTLARLVGDEFVILLEDIVNIEAAEDIASRIGKYLSLPFSARSEKILMSVSIGICGIYNNKVTADIVLRNADMAMSQAKLLGRRRYFVFNEAICATSMNLLRMEKDLHFALARNELYVLYQPIVNLSDMSIVGFESLIRWKHPVMGVISPDKFIPLAEASGLIRSIGEFVFKVTCEQLVKWRSLDFLKEIKCKGPIKSIEVSVNLSINQLSDSETVDHLLKIIDSYPISDLGLKIEITESVLAQNIEMCAVHLEKFKSRNIKLSIDDFGTGYSSLSYLDSLPFDVLKIDKSFIDRIPTDEKSRSMVSGIINLAHNLHYEIIAEGIETLEQMHLLKDMECEYGQGYLFSKPVSAEEAELLIQNGFFKPTDAFGESSIVTRRSNQR